MRIMIDTNLLVSAFVLSSSYLLKLIDVISELVYTPEKIDKSKYPPIRDIKDLPILVSAIIEDVDIILTNDLDFAALEIEKPEILKPKEFLNKYY